MEASNKVAFVGKTGNPTNEETEMKIVSRFADEHCREMELLSRDFEEMGSLRLWWDSKIPEEEKAWYYWFKSTSSNREEVIEKIKKYRKFYEKMGNAVKKIHSNEISDTEKIDLHDEILVLRDKLEKMLKKAKSGENATASKAVYRLHEEFISSSMKLKSMVKSVEVVSMKQKIDIANQRWMESTERIDRLREEVKKSDRRYDDLTAEVKRVEEKYEEDRIKSKEHQACLEEQNRKLAEQNKQAFEDRRKFEEQQARLEEQNRKLAEQNKQAFEDRRKFEEQQARVGALISQNAELADLCKKLLSDKQEMEKDKSRLEKENEFLLI